MTDIKKINQTVEFQAGSVVSKEIINKPTGSITFFAFDKEQGLSEHTAPYDALVIIVEGTADITVSGEKNEVTAGEMLLMPAGAPHSLKAIQPFKMVLIMIKS